MIILDYPYVSGILQQTLKDLQIPVLRNKATGEMNLNDGLVYLGDSEFVSRAKNNDIPFIYSNSENSIDWIISNLSFTGLPKHIHNFKDKVRFREIIQDIYPDFFYKRISFHELDKVDLTGLPMKFVIKPAIGFFSLGVHVVSNRTEWPRIKDLIKREINNYGMNYPAEVVNTSSFIIEEIIPGNEFAVDVYYDNNGKAVILNILKHLFASEEDVSDRIYITSREIMETYFDDFYNFLTVLGRRMNLKGFPMHVEFRMDQHGNIVPIEVNPMRFAGWCVTDIALYAYGINVYQYFFEQKKPDWEKILSDMGDEIYSVAIADLPRDIPVDSIYEIDYNKFLASFEEPLELRKIDYKKHGVFAFLFSRTSAKNMFMLEEILKSDLKEYLMMRD